MTAKTIVLSEFPKTVSLYSANGVRVAVPGFRWGLKGGSLTVPLKTARVTEEAAFAGLLGILTDPEVYVMEDK